MQADLARAQKELATGKRADIGLDLGGAGASEVGKLRHTRAWQDALTATNSIGVTRLDASQTALADIHDGAQTFLNQLLTARSSPANPVVLATVAAQTLSGMIENLNASIAGVHVFGGDNSGFAPLTPYFANGSTNSQAIIAAFTSAFGFAPDDPQVSNITPAQMNIFLDGPFASEFSDPNWTGNWSSASDQGAVLQIGTNREIEIGASANEGPFRQLAQAYVMISALGADKLNNATWGELVERAIGLTSAAINGATAAQARLGVTQQQIASANDRIATEGQIITNRLDRMEAIDPYAAVSTINTLMTQLQASYAATARIQQLSILNYL